MNAKKKIISTLRKLYPQSETALDFKNPLQILVATILSAQCTDKRVNMVTKGLFKKYSTINDFAKAEIKTFEKEIRSTGFYRNKAKNIINAANKIETDFGGKVPDSMEHLLTLPGVARKTANIVLFNGFGKLEGIAVDTHVARLSMRLGLSKHKEPVKIEKDLMKLFPRKQWGDISNILIAHGRAVCSARKPKCCECKLVRVCPSSECKQ